MTKKAIEGTLGQNTIQKHTYIHPYIHAWSNHIMHVQIQMGFIHSNYALTNQNLMDKN